MSLQEDFTKLETDLQGLILDAKRYRWLKDTGAVFTVKSSGNGGTECELRDIGRPAIGLDTAVDAQMAKR